MGKHKTEKQQKCIGCDFYENDKVSDDGDWVEGWGCCCPTECSGAAQQADRAIEQHNFARLVRRGVVVSEEKGGGLQKDDDPPRGHGLL